MSAKTSFIRPGDAKAAGSTIVYSCELNDENGNVVGPSSLTSLTLSIVDTATGAIVNGVEGISILNTGRGTIDDQGNLVVTIGPPNAGDTALLTATDQNERRSLVIVGTYGSGKVLEHEAIIALTRLSGG